MIKLLKMGEYKEIRGERRSFYCSNKLWFKIKEECKDCYSVSWFICKAIEEKLKNAKY